MPRAASIECRFCGERTRDHPLTGDGLAWLNGLYLAHLVESHWSDLISMREQRLSQDMSLAAVTAWKRL